MDDNMVIRCSADVEAIIGEPLEQARLKVRNELDAVMREFVALSPLIFVSTIDENGHIDTSPKGDPPGFVEANDSGDLLIPERPGNKLTFGFLNILNNSQIGLIFVVPNQRETLRVKGTATLHRDPAVLERMAVKGRAALMYTRVSVHECFFHCGKALIRSKVWEPASWDLGDELLAARRFASPGGEATEEAVKALSERLERAYADELY